MNDRTAVETDDATTTAPDADAMSEGDKLAFKVVSASTLPVWAAMIIAPNSRLTERLVRLATPLCAALGGAYVGFLAKEMIEGDGEMPGFDDPEAMREALSSPTAFLAGWTHYVVFDLFVGRWIWADARERGRTARLSLLLTWVAGPAGLSMHLARNALGRIRGGSARALED